MQRTTTAPKNNTVHTASHRGFNACQRRQNWRGGLLPHALLVSSPLPSRADIFSIFSCSPLALLFSKLSAQRVVTRPPHYFDGAPFFVTVRSGSALPDEVAAPWPVAIGVRLLILSQLSVPEPHFWQAVEGERRGQQWGEMCQRLLS